MKQKILLTALAQFGLAAVLGIGNIVFSSFATVEAFELTAKIYIISSILGTTGICTGLVGAVFPKEV